MEKKDFIEDDSQKMSGNDNAQEKYDNIIEPRAMHYIGNYFAVIEGNSSKRKGSYEAWNGQVSIISEEEHSPITFYVGREYYSKSFVEFQRSKLAGAPVIYSPNEHLGIVSNGSLELSTGGRGYTDISAEADIMITRDGRVGIGTSSPGEKLDINGDTRVDGKLFAGYTNGEVIKISTTNKNKYALFVQKGVLSEDFAIGPKSSWSDSVFKKDYKLRSLNEVEKFIKTNNHLQEIPSAKEIQEEGYSLHDMNVKLLQKIEELTLYVIQLNKEIEGLKKEN